MNVEEIKRRLRSGNQINLEPPTKKVEEKEDAIYIAPKDEQKQMSHTEVFSQESDSESEPENSETWNVPIGMENINGEIDPKSFINQLDLDKPKYDWRETTKKGRNSRKNFSNYILTVV